MSSEIKNILSLDVSKFSSAIDRAIGGAESLETHLKSAAKVAADFDKGITGVGSDLTGIADKFRMLDKTIENLVVELVGITGKFDDMGRHTSTASKGIDQLGTAVKRVTGINADQWVKKYSEELDKLAPALKSAVASIIDFDRANIASAASAERAAGKTAAAKLKSLESERDGNKKIIAEREQLMRELASIQERMQGRADGNAAVAKNYFGKNYSKGESYRQEASVAQEAANAAAGEIAALEAVIKEMKWKNAEIAKSISLIRQETATVEQKASADKVAAEASATAKKAEKEAALAAKEAAAESARFAKDAARQRIAAAREAAEFERQQAQQIAQMWKGMGQMWAASKIERGMGAVVSETARGQRAELQLKALNLPTNEFVEFKEKAFDLAKENKYLSFIDSLRARLVGLTSLGGNHVDILDKTVGHAVQSAQALKAGGYEHGDMNDIVANLYGTAEMRQITADPEAMKRNFDLMTKIGVGSRGKLNIADFDTVWRNLGQGAGSITDEGILRIMGLMEQQKVAGHSSSASSGAGVSSVGTMIKMAQLYAQGKPVSDNLLEQLIGAGVMSGDIDKDRVKGGMSEHKAMMRAMKTAGFNNSDEVMADPVKALWEMRAPIIEFMKGSKKNRDLYFGNAKDINSEEAERNAINKFWARSGLSNKAVTQNSTAMDPRYHKRSEEIAELAKGSLNGADILKEAAPNWDQAVASFKKGASDLTSAFDPFVKQLSGVVDWIGKILGAAGAFARENPMIANVALITTGVIGMNLAIKGVINTFGMVGSAANIFKTLAANAGQTSTSTMAATTSMAGFGAAATRSASASIQNAMANERSAEAARVHALRQLESAQALVASKTGFDRLRAVQETLVPAQQNAAKATADYAAAHLAVGQAASTASVATKAMAGASKLLSGALSLVGGPIGLISIALIAGISIWENWGKAAETAAGKASKAADAALDKLQKLKDEDKYGSGDLGAERKTLEQLEETLNLKVQGRASDVAEFRQKVENQQALVDALERRQAAATQAPKPTTPAPKGGSFGGVNSDFALPTVGKNQREFENNFQRSLEQFVGRQNIEQLKLGTILNKTPSYDEQAKAAFTEKWLGGDFDDGKDPSKRKFVKGDQAYDKARGWKAEDIDWSATDAQTKKRVQDWLDAYKAAKQLEDVIKGVTFATERAAATDEESTVALDRLTKKTAGQTDAMKALNREFAREEARNPAILNDQRYLTEKREAKTGRATADYANNAADLVQKNKEMEAQFLETTRERLLASVNAQADAERQKVQILMDSLDEQVRAHEAAGDLESEAYKKAIQARKDGEEEYTRYLRNVEEQRRRNSETSTQKMVRDWGSLYENLDKLGDKWAGSFMDTMTDLITTGKADWRKFTVGLLSDLSKVLMQKGIASLVGGPEGVGGATLGGLAKKGIDWLGGKFGWGANPGAGVTVPAGGGVGGGIAAPAPGMDGALGGGLKGGLGVGAGSEATDAAKELGDSMKGAGEAAQATAAATEAATVAKEMETVAVETSTTVTEADAAVVSTSTAATTANVVATEMDTVATVADAGATELSTVATVTDTAAEWLEVTANEVSAATEYLANGGVATPMGLSFFADGGAFTNGVYSDPTLFKFANGGQFGVMGEAGPEAVMPLSRDGKGRLGVTVNNSEGDAGGTMVNIAITVNSDGEKASASGDGAGDWRKMANRIKGVVIEELVAQQRPGGVLYK